MFYWLLKLVVLGPLLRLVFRPKVEGLKNVPRTGPVILACNHLSFSDSIFTPLIMKRKVTFVAKAEYFTGKGIKGWFSRMFFIGAGTIPVDRSGGQAAQAALDTLLRVLREGNIAGIYPEGTRSPDGRLYRGKTGVARLALESLFIGMLGTALAVIIGFTLALLATRVPHLPDAPRDPRFARMAALLAGLPESVPGATVNRLCASGLEAINIAARMIEAGHGSPAHFQ